MKSLLAELAGPCSASASIPLLDRTGTGRYSVPTLFASAWDGVLLCTNSVLPVLASNHTPLNGVGLCFPALCLPFARSTSVPLIASRSSARALPVACC